MPTAARTCVHVGRRGEASRCSTVANSGEIRGTFGEHNCTGAQGSAARLTRSCASSTLGCLACAASWAQYGTTARLGHEQRHPRKPRARMYTPWPPARKNIRCSVHSSAARSIKLMSIPLTWSLLAHATAVSHRAGHSAVRRLCLAATRCAIPEQSRWHLAQRRSADTRALVRAHRGRAHFISSRHLRPNSCSLRDCHCLQTGQRTMPRRAGAWRNIQVAV